MYGSTAAPIPNLASTAFSLPASAVIMYAGSSVGFIFFAKITRAIKQITQPIRSTNSAPTKLPTKAAGTM